MKNIEAILEEFDLSDEQKKTIIDGVKENYKTVNELEQKKEKLATAQAEIDRLNAEMGELKSTIEGSSEKDETIDQLKQQLKEHSDAEEARKKAEAEAEKTKKLRESFTSVEESLGGFIPFASDGIFAKASSLLDENPAIGMENAVKKAIEGMDGVIVNKQTTPPNQAVPGKSDAVPANLTADEIRTWSPEKINENWDAVRKVLESQKKE